MPGSRVLHAAVGDLNWYYGNTRSDATPDGFGQEETIKAIWAASDEHSHRTVSNSDANDNGILDCYAAEEFRYSLNQIKKLLGKLKKGDIPADVLDLFNLGRRPVSFGDFQLQASANIERDWREGSNNWAVAPERTSTGRPILANDPHRAHSVPSLRYIW